MLDYTYLNCFNVKADLFEPFEDHLLAISYDASKGILNITLKDTVDAQEMELLLLATTGETPFKKEVK